MHDEQFEMSFPVINTRCPSLLLKVQCVNTPNLVGHSKAVPGKIDRMTDAAHEAYALYRKSNRSNDLKSARQSFQAVIDRCPVGHPSRAAALSNLAHVILHAFTKDTRIDIERAISFLRSTLALNPPGHPDHPVSILNLCKALHKCHSHRKGHADLREVAELYRSLLPLCVEGSYLQLHTIEQCNALPRDTSDESIMLRRTVLEYCRPRHQYRARTLNRLAGDLYTCFRRSGKVDYIHEAVDLSREALAECPADGRRSFFLSVLSYTLKLRFYRLRYPDDINECISLNREALTLRPPGHPARHTSLNNLAKALKARYIYNGNTTDIEETIHLHRAAYDLCAGCSRSPPPPSQHDEECGDLESSCTLEPEQGQLQPGKSTLNSYEVRVLFLHSTLIPY
ncbi:hypothetical protein M405DRAFT_801461 [Rhizopogon salebrosus TDB-379]|nr:hypothetical protein M405DRAFT_801461 [Rhizopogon salebrosus TDB-379]